MSESSLADLTLPRPPCPSLSPRLCFISQFLKVVLLLLELTRGGGRAYSTRFEVNPKWHIGKVTDGLCWKVYVPELRTREIRVLHRTPLTLALRLATT